MIRKSIIIKSLTALVMSALSSTIVQAEVLVPLDQFLATTTRHYEVNQYKTAYTVYIPQSELQGDTVILNPAAVGEPVKLPITKKDGISYVDIEFEPVMLGVSYTKNNGQLILGPAPEASTVKAPYTLQTPLAWAFDPWTTEGIPYQAKLNTSGDNIISPSWFKLHSLGLEASPNINIDYVKAYKDKGYHIWPLITNRFDSNFTSGILADQSVWKKYAHNLVQYAYIYGFDGYNFDFENIDYAATNGILSRLIYIIHIFKTITMQHIRYKSSIHLFTHTQFQGLIAQFLTGYHFLSQRIGISDDTQSFLSFLQTAQHLRTQNLIGCVFLPIFNRATE